MTLRPGDPVISNNAGEISELRRREREQEREDKECITAVIDRGDVYGAAQYAVGLGLSDEVPRRVHALWAAGLLAGPPLKDAVWAARASGAAVRELLAVIDADQIDATHKRIWHLRGTSVRGSRISLTMIPRSSVP